MKPQFLEQLFSPEITLPHDTEVYIQVVYEKLVDDQPVCKDSAEEIAQIFTQAVENRDSDGINIALATALAWQIRDVIFDKTDDRDLKTGEVWARDQLGEVIQCGMKVNRRLGKIGIEPFIEKGSKYSPLIVASGCTQGVKQIFGYESDRDLKRLRHHITVPSAFR